MKVVFSDKQLGHSPKMFLVNGVTRPNPELPERATRLLDSATEAGLERAVPRDHGLAPLARVHTPEYIDFLSTIHERWRRIEGASDEVIPNVHPDRRDGAYPDSAVGQAGYHLADTACPIGAQTWEAILWTANTSTEAALVVCNGEPSAYALCRPGGHHAFRDLAGGFCYVNNCAVAVETLRSSFERIAVIDVDVHHGNGTQSIFYRRPDVLMVSIHADPARFYPFFRGHANERGAGPGLGFNLNLPLPRGTADDAYLAVLDMALQRVRAFAPDALAVSLGLDAYEGDPLAGLRISTEGFGRIAERIGALRLPTVLVQEGGYLGEGLARNLGRFVMAFQESHTQ